MEDLKKDLQAAKKALWVKRRECLKLREDLTDARAAAVVRTAQFQKQKEINKDLVEENEDLKQRVKTFVENEGRREKALEAAKYASDVLQTEAQAANERCQELQARMEELSNAYEEAARNADASLRSKERKILDLTHKIADMESEIWALQDQIERFNDRAGYPVDVDPVTAERLREDNKLLKEEIRVMEKWIGDLI